jgi:hypothetical protein
MYFECERGDLHLNAGYNFSSININKRPDGGSQLEPNNVTMNKLIRTDVVCD